VFVFANIDVGNRFFRRRGSHSHNNQLIGGGRSAHGLEKRSQYGECAKKKKKEIWFQLSFAVSMRKDTTTSPARTGGGELSGCKSPQQVQKRGSRQSVARDFRIVITPAEKKAVWDHRKEGFAFEGRCMASMYRHRRKEFVQSLERNKRTRDLGPLGGRGER